MNGLGRMGVLCVISLALASGTALGAGYRRSDRFEYRKVWFSGKAITAVLLNNGTVVSYFEETRPATEEEKARRIEEFERQWKELEAKAKESQRQVEPFLPRFPFYAIVSEFFNMVSRVGMQIAYALGRRYVLNAPVVTGAGLVFVSGEGVERKVVVDVAETYGPEAWQRMPTGAVQMRASGDGRFVGLETERGGIAVYQLKGDVTFRGRVEGRHPFGFSPSGAYMFVTKENGVFQLYRLPPEGAGERKPVLPEFLAIREVKVEIPKGIAMTDVALLDERLLVLTWKELVVYDWERETMRRFGFNSYGGRSLLVTSKGDVFVAKMDGTLARVDLGEGRAYDMKMNGFDLLKRHRVYFHKLVSLSPDKRWVAALYDPGVIPPGGGLWGNRDCSCGISEWER